MTTSVSLRQPHVMHVGHCETGFQSRWRRRSGVRCEVPDPNPLLTTVQSLIARQVQPNDLVRLLEEVETVVESVARGFDGLVQTTILDEAGGHIVDQLTNRKFDCNRAKHGDQSLKSWIRLTVKNFGIDCWRRIDSRQRRERDQARLSQADEVDVETLCELGEGLRDLLTEMRWESAGEVNWYALFLLRLRLGMAKKISKAFRKRDDHVTPVRVLNVWLPWNAEEEQMQIDLDGANLVDIWEKIGEELNEPPCWMTLDRCRELINRMQGWEMSKSCWDKRIERAINAASERTTTEQWEQFIAPFVRRKGKSN